MLLNKCIMENIEEDKYPEPPELKAQHVPPLMKIVKYLFIAIAVAFVVVLVFSISFWLRNR
jgi:cell division protein FtsL